MRALHLFFRLHRPYELKPVDGVETDLFGGEAAFREANRTEYQPFLALLERNTQKYPKFVFSLAISGVWLEQAEQWDPELVRRLRKLVNLGHAQLLAEPYYYSLASFYNADEFESQMSLHKKKMEYVFGVECQVVAMPELMYNDKIAKWADEAGFSGILAGGAEQILQWQNINQVFEAEGCDNLRVLCQNSRFSHAIMQGHELVMVEGVKTSNEFTESPEDVQEIVSKARKKATVAEFVRGLHNSGETKVNDITRTKKIARMTTGQMVFSAKKLQKELDIECLRGNMISICLDTQIFSRFRSDGIVRFFDEFISNWLKVPGNHFVRASELIDGSQPAATLSAPTTIDWRLKERSRRYGLIALDAAQFCPPEWLNLPMQQRLSERVYAMRDNVLMTNDEVLRYYFGRLTCLDYIAMINPACPVLVGDAYARKRHEDLAQSNLEHFEAVLDDFMQQIISKQPQPQKLAAATESTDQQNIFDATVKNDDLQVDQSSDFSVKVHRGKPKMSKSGINIVQQKGDVTAGSQAKARRRATNVAFRQRNQTAQDISDSNPGVEYGKIVDHGPVAAGEDWGSRMANAQDVLDYKENGIGAPFEVEETDEVDDVATEVQVLAQRLAQNRNSGRSYDDLTEAEIIVQESVAKSVKTGSIKKSKPKKRILRRLTIE